MRVSRVAVNTRPARAGVAVSGLREERVQEEAGQCGGNSRRVAAGFSNLE